MGGVVVTVLGNAACCQGSLQVSFRVVETDVYDEDKNTAAGVPGGLSC